MLRHHLTFFDACGIYLYFFMIFEPQFSDACIEVIQLGQSLVKSLLQEV